MPGYPGKVAYLGEGVGARTSWACWSGGHAQIRFVGLDLLCPRVHWCEVWGVGVGSPVGWLPKVRGTGEGDPLVHMSWTHGARGCCLYPLGAVAVGLTVWGLP